MVALVAGSVFSAMNDEHLKDTDRVLLELRCECRGHWKTMDSKKRKKALDAAARVSGVFRARRNLGSVGYTIFFSHERVFAKFGEQCASNGFF